MAGPGPRPSAVHPEAEWYFDSGEWVHCRRDREGELDGPLRAHRADGMPSLEFEYRHGKRHGPFRRFYASGQLAQAGRYLDDVPDGLLSVYSEGDDVSTIRECCVPVAARSMRQEYRRGELLAESCYDAADCLLPDAEGAFGAAGFSQPLREREADVLELEYDFWPAREPLSFDVEDAAQARVEQALGAFRDVIQRAAQRVHVCRSELAARGSSRLPPDLSALIAGRPLELRRFFFRSADAEATLVHVDETLTVSALSTPELIARTQLEWCALCWLCWASGATSRSLPEQLAPRPDLYAALVRASERQAALSGHQLRPEREPHFHGLDETLLPATALAHLAQCYREIRAVLLFVSDPECQSAWQDDLGRAEAAPEP